MNRRLLLSWIRRSRDDDAGAGSAASPPAGDGVGFISAFVGAMHESRRNRAAREIYRHQDFAREAEAYENRRLAELRGDARRDSVVASILLGGYN